MRFLFSLLLVGELFKSCVADNIWTLSNAPNSTTWHALSTSLNGQFASAAFWDGPIYNSNDFGLTWVASSSPNLRWMNIASDDSGQHLYAVTYVGDVYSSSDYGHTWDVTFPTGGSLNLDSVTTNRNGQYVYVGSLAGQGLYYSHNYGQSWNQYTYLCDKTNQLMCGTLYAIATSDSGSNVIAVTTQNGCYKSVNFGVTFEPMESIAKLMLGDSNSYQAVSMSASGQYVLIGSYQSNYYSSDYGETFAYMTLLNDYIVNFAMDSTGQHVVADSTHSNVWRSDDYGVSWVKYTSSDSNNSTVLHEYKGVTSDSTGKNYIIIDGNFIYTHAGESSAAAAVAGKV